MVDAAGVEDVEDEELLNPLESPDPVLLAAEALLAELSAFRTVSINLLPALPPVLPVVPLPQESIWIKLDPRNSSDFLLTSSTKELSREARVLICKIKWNGNC
jgi:hypothetical protein